MQKTREGRRYCQVFEGVRGNGKNGVIGAHAAASHLLHADM
jgi:hypothetical protein